jgi:hypothetical protein
VSTRLQECTGALTELSGLLNQRGMPNGVDVHGKFCPCAICGQAYLPRLEEGCRALS